MPEKYASDNLGKITYTDSFISFLMFFNIFQNFQNKHKLPYAIKKKS